MIPLLVMLSAWVLWHDVAVYRVAAQARVGGPTYDVSSYVTKVECETEQRAAMARAGQLRGGPLTEALSDGIVVWDPDRLYYTTFRYLCWPAGGGAAPFR